MNTDTKEERINQNDIFINLTELNFSGARQTKQIVCLWACEKVKGVKLKMSELNHFQLDYDLYEDEVEGRCIIDVSADRSPTETWNENLFLTFKNEEGYYQHITIPVVQTSTQADNKFITFSKSAVVVPYTHTSTDVKYLALNDTITEVLDDRSNGIYTRLDTLNKVIRIQSDYDSFVAPGQLSKKGKVTVKTQNSGDLYIEVFILLPRALPIWKPMIVSSTTTRPVDYKINVMEDEVSESVEPIYTGRAFPEPGKDRIEINLPAICENYLRTEIDFYQRNTLQERYAEWSRIFILYINEKPVGSYCYYNDWTYDTGGYAWTANTPIGHPIRRTVQRGQLFTASWFHSQLHPGNTVNNMLEESPDKINWTPIIGEKAVETLQRSDIVYDTNLLKPDTKYLKTGKGDAYIYEVINECRIRYVLHYLAKAGNYESIPVEAYTNRYSTSEPLKITRSVISPVYHKDYVYRTVNRRRWEVTLPLLKKEESNRIDEITESPQVWLEKIGGEITPVVITNSETDFQNNRKIRNFTLTLEADARIRQ